METLLVSSRADNVTVSQWPLAMHGVLRYLEKRSEIDVFNAPGGCRKGGD